MDRPFRMPKARFSTYLLAATVVPTILAALIASGAGSAWNRHRDRSAQTGKLLSAGSYAASVMRELPLGLADPALPRLLKSFAAIDGIRITVVLRDGTVLADTAAADPAALENHASRAEIAAALAGRIGAEERTSASTGGAYLYAAQPYREKEEIVAAVRAAKPSAAIAEERKIDRRNFAAFALLYVALAAAVSYTVSGIFGKYARRMSDGAARMADGRFDLRLKRVHIEELDVLGESLNRMAAAISRNMAELREAVSAKEAYLKELQHRVKNNLNVVSSLINLEIDRLSDDSARQSFREMSARVDTISRVYETLYKSADLETVDGKSYLEGLAAGIHRAYLGHADSCELRMEIDSLRLDSQRALPLGLILNEALTNALKYAFPPPRTGAITVRFAETDEGLLFSVSDDGIGFPADFDPHGSETLGLQLIGMLAAQLGAALSIRGERGVAVELRIPR